MKRYNNYNIFFMPERQHLLLQSRGGAMAITVGGVATCSVVTQAVDSVEVNNRPRPSNNDITEENLRPPGEPSEATPILYYRRYVAGMPTYHCLVTIGWRNS